MIVLGIMEVVNTGLACRVLEMAGERTVCWDLATFGGSVDKEKGAVIDSNLPGHQSS